MMIKALIAVVILATGASASAGNCKRKNFSKQRKKQATTVLEIANVTTSLNRLEIEEKNVFRQIPQVDLESKKTKRKEVPGHEYLYDYGFWWTPVKGGLNSRDLLHEKKLTFFEGVTAFAGSSKANIRCPMLKGGWDRLSFSPVNDLSKI